MCSVKQIIAGVVMMVSLLWLAVSPPFVYAAAQAHQEIQKQAGNVEDNNPLTGTAEEKSETGGSTLSEYIHDLQLINHHFVILTRFYKCHPSDLYFDYHPLLITPPPEA